MIKFAKQHGLLCYGNLPYEKALRHTKQDIKKLEDTGVRELKAWLRKNSDRQKQLDEYLEPDWAILGTSRVPRLMHEYRIHTLVDVTENGNLKQPFPFKTPAGVEIHDKHTLSVARDQNSKLLNNGATAPDEG